MPSMDLGVRVVYLMLTIMLLKVIWMPQLLVSPFIHRLCLGDSVHPTLAERYRPQYFHPMSGIRGPSACILT
jgi:hypothetical protein